MKRSSATTLRDVANRVGVHFSTVSRALNPDTRKLVDAKLVEKIVKAAKELRYQPNFNAVGLKTQRSYIINVLLPDSGDPIYPPMVRGVRQRLAQTSFLAIVGDAERVTGQERFSLLAMKMRPTGGLILATAKPSDRFIAEAIREQVPLVQVIRTTTKRVSSTVIVDQQIGMQLAVEHLRMLGHTEIALLASPKTLSTGVIEADAFRKAMLKAGLKASGGTTVHADDSTIRSGAAAMLQLLDKPNRITAVVAAHDMLALGAIDAARARGRACPDDISVVGCFDLPLVDRVSPPLTTMSVDFSKLGWLAADLMLRAIDYPSEIVEHRIEPALVIRQSTAVRL